MHSCVNFMAPYSCISHPKQDHDIKIMLHGISMGLGIYSDYPELRMCTASIKDQLELPSWPPDTQLSDEHAPHSGTT